MELDEKQKKIAVIAAVVIVILLIGGYLMFGRNKTEKPQAGEQLPTEVVIPTVDGSVKVDLVSSSLGREIVLQLKSIPNRTKSIDYELSYQTKQQGLQGVIGTIQLSRGENEYDKKLTLGTCSSGTCIYHEVVGKIRLNLKFSGNYGEKVFEKEYEV